ncbi:gamma-glutamyl-gamma-aminobutyrate hydrolase family protein [Phytohabitans rumicis]|uniref:Glutamine amidotransferase n=1 Tax=Phytohabitans rumicis TaxID=1076125 RepID=A0A6V8L0H1_9ACTN|nr:gamma-glutamyl-gamma-aminobutyrate hydrolase family protein [Phytohabitans rumicis]GFJ87597.1 glutamine amidotransferase [Phytohabitans rumicis]
MNPEHTYPIVGVTQRAFRPTQTQYERRDGLDIRWHHFLQAVEAICLPLPNDPSIAVRHALRFGVQALVFSGGEAIAPCDGQSPARDATEGALLAWALHNATPIVGVCRGMQFLLDYFGGKLRRVDGHLGVDHTMLINGVARDVRCHHRWGAYDAPSGFEVLTRAGSVIEQVRHVSYPITGMMWHPERRPVFDHRDVLLMRVALGLDRG